MGACTLLKFAMVRGPFQPATDMATFITTLPPRLRGLKILCYNVNGLRAALGLGAKKDGGRGAAFQKYIATEDPDVLCLQEVKVDEEIIVKESLSTIFPTLPHAYW